MEDSELNTSFLATPNKFEDKLMPCLSNDNLCAIKLFSPFNEIQKSMLTSYNIIARDIIELYLELLYTGIFLDRLAKEVNLNKSSTYVHIPSP